MKIHDVAQNSPEWHQLRCGIPSSSEFDKILCPEFSCGYACRECGLEIPRKRKLCTACSCEVIAYEKPKLSTQRDAYLKQLVAEWYTGEPRQGIETMYMQQGHEMEPYAVESYEFERSVEVQTVGFITTDGGMIGSSPDRLVGDDGILEIKSPAPHTHVGYMLDPDSLAREYKAQLQGQLWVCERKWADIQSYCRGFKSVIVRVEPDLKYQNAQKEALAGFLQDMLEMREALEERWGKHAEPTVPVDYLGVTDEDVDAILAARRI